MDRFQSMFRSPRYFTFGTIALIFGIGALLVLEPGQDMAAAIAIMISAAGIFGIYLGTAAAIRRRRPVARNGGFPDRAPSASHPPEPPRIQRDAASRAVAPSPPETIAPESPRENGPPRPPLFVTMNPPSKQKQFWEEETLAKFRDRRFELYCHRGTSTSRYRFALWRIKLVDDDLCIFGGGDYIDPSTGRRRPEPGWVTIRVNALTYLWDFKLERAFEGDEIEKFVLGLVDEANRPE